MKRIKDNSIIKSDDDTNRFISLAICSQISIIGIKNMLVQAIPILYENNNIINYILTVIFALMYAFVLFRDKKCLKIDRLSFIIIMFILFSFIFTVLIHPDNTKYIVSHLPRIIPYCFITWYLITKLTTLKWIDYCMKKFSVYIIIFSIISGLAIKYFGHITTSTWSTYSMPLSYVTMIGVMWTLKEFFNSDKNIWLFLSLIGIFIIIVYGSRNPLIAITIYSIITIIRKTINKNNGKFRVKYLIFIIGIVTCTFFLKEFINLLNTIVQVVGLSSRTLFLLNSNIMDLSGRDVIHTELIKYINQSPIIGLGVFGDEVVLMQSKMNQSAHSLYLSIFACYGYIIGSLLITYLISISIKALKKADIDEKEILIIFLCLVWPRGFSGGDVWTSDVFWWMLGIILVILKKKIR